MRNVFESMDLCNWVLAVFIVVLFGGGIVCAIRYAVIRSAQMEAFAKSHGGVYSKKDKDGVREKLQPFFPGRLLGLSKIVTFQSAGAVFHVFDGSHRYSGKSKSGHDRTGCMILSPRFHDSGAGADAVEILERDGLDAFWGPEHFDLGGPDFVKQFVIVAGNRAVAQRVITPALQQLLLRFRQAPDHTNLSVSINGSGAVVLIGSGALPEKMDALLELCRNIESAVLTKTGAL